MKVVISQDRIKALKENKEEITYFSFFTHVKNFIKQLLQNPTNASASDNLKEYFGCDDKHIVEKLIDADIIRRKNNIIETPKEVTADNKSKVRYSIQYIVPKKNFKEKIQQLFQKEILSENTENEYLDKYFGKSLEDYLKKYDYDNDAINRNLLAYDGAFTFFHRYIIKNDIPIPKVEIDEIRERCEDFDETLIDDLYSGKYRKYLEGFLDFVSLYVLDNQPTSSVMSYRNRIDCEWLVHFSDNAKEIWEEGFQYATDDIDRLGYSGAGSINNKESEGFCFAYTLRDLRNNGHHNYGSEAVMFIASGVRATHYGDEEDQVMFWNKDAKDIVYLQNNSSYGWFVGDTYGDRVFYYSDEIMNVIDWVIENLNQYRRWLINPREHKNFQNNQKKSIYTYNLEHPQIYESDGQRIQRNNKENNSEMLSNKQINKIIREAIEKVLTEDGEGGGGATNCAGVMQGGGTNPSAGQYDVPVFGNDKEGKKRSKDFSNGSIMMQRLKEDWEKINKNTNCQYRPIYKPTIKTKK